MKKIYAIFILFFVLCACATGQKKNEIVVCGDDKVWIVNVDNSEGKNLDIVWKWNAQESNIPDDFKKYFQQTNLLYLLLLHLSVYQYSLLLKLSWNKDMN